LCDIEASADALAQQMDEDLTMVRTSKTAERRD
jgi:hypothetical protein